MVVPEKTQKLKLLPLPPAALDEVQSAVVYERHGTEEPVCENEEIKEVATSA